MEIIYGEYPPNYAEIAKVFKIKDNPGIVFTYGYKLYVPAGKIVEVDKHLLAHEKIHALRQTEMGVEEWWKKYLEDSSFRLVQEVEAYRQQYRSMWSLPISQRAGYLNHIVKDLSGTMYGNVVTPEQALQLITDGITLKRRFPAIANTSKAIRKLKKRKRQNRKKGRKS